jgi:hypothetical protein
MLGSYGRAATRHDTVSPSDVANEIAHTAPVAQLLCYIGVLLAAIGGLAVVPSGVLWFLARQKDLQTR